MKLRWLKKLLAPAQGQSLVEMAITAPILIFMMIGLFEVGWALRGYLVLANVNREITRFAVRPGYMNFSTKADVITSFTRIHDWVTTADSGQLNLDFSPEITGNAALIVAHVVVDTGLPCKDIVTNPAGCECERFDPAKANYLPSQIFPDDDLIIHPADSRYTYQTMSFPPITATRPISGTRIDYAALVSETLIPENNRFNCQILKKGGVASANNLIINQIHYDQPQLVGFPLISNPFTDPVPMYAHTTMRLSTGARSTGSEAGSIVANIDTIGPVCSAMPIIVKNTLLPAIGSTVDVLAGNGGSDGGWLSWNPAKSTDLTYLKDQIKFPPLSLNDFTDANEPSDHTLSKLDDVTSWSGAIPPLADQAEIKLLLEGQTVNILVWDTFTGGKYHIFDIIQVQINTVDVAAQTIIATYLGPGSEACQ